MMPRDLMPLGVTADWCLMQLFAGGATRLSDGAVVLTDRCSLAAGV